MKRLILLLALVCASPCLQATHLLGGEISYQYIGDSTGTDNEYLVKLIYYRDASPGTAGLGNLASICVKSSCGGFSLYLYSNSSSPGALLLNPCDTNSGALNSNFRPVEVFTYQGTVILSDSCTDYEFFSRTCCRPAGIDNLVDPTSVGLSLSAYLKAPMNENDSPQFQKFQYGNFCSSANTTVNWHHPVEKTNGDSIYYRFSYQQRSNINSCTANPLEAIPLSANYSIFQPFASASPIILDEATGTLNFSLNQPQVATVRIVVEEFRKDSLFNYYYKVGSITRDVSLHISGVCSNTSQNWQFSTADSANYYHFSPPGCGDSTLYLFSSQAIDTSTLSKDGSDFRLYNSLGQILPITAARFISYQRFNSTYLLALDVYPSLWYNDSLILTMQAGSDGNTLLSPCGYEAPAGDSLIIAIQGCQSSVSLQEKQWGQIRCYPNPTEGKLRLETPENKPSVLRIYTPGGQLMLQRAIRGGPQEVNLSHLARGAYLLELSFEGKLHQERLIIQ